MKRTFNGRVASALLVMLFFTMGFDPVFAAKPNCPEDPTHPACKSDDPDPGDESLTLENVYAWWGHVNPEFDGLVHDQEADGTLYEGRECNASGTLSQGYVAYGCPWENQVHFTLPPPNPEDTIGKERELCSQLGDFLIGGSNVIQIGDSTVNTGAGDITAFHFTMDPTWNDGKCTEGNQDQACLVRVRMTAYFYDWCNAKKCGRLMLVRGWGRAQPAGLVDGLVELNPFYYDQVIDIHDLEIHFMGIGTNRGVAECHWYDSGVQYLTDNPNRD